MIFPATETTITFFFSVVQIKPLFTVLLLWGRALINVANVYLLMALWDDSSLAKFQSVKMRLVTVATDQRPIHQRQALSHPRCQAVLTVLIHLYPATLIPSLLHSLLHPLTRCSDSLQPDASWSSSERRRFQVLEVQMWLRNLLQNLVGCTSLLRNGPSIWFHSGVWSIDCSRVWTTGGTIIQANPMTDRFDWLQASYVSSSSATWEDQ